MFSVESVIVEFPNSKRWEGLLREIETARYRLPAYDRENIVTIEETVPLVDKWRFMDQCI